MGQLTPSFLFDLESRMQVITENEYQRMSSNMWAPRIMKTRPSSSKRELLTWFLSTAMIEDQGAGGNVAFEDLVSTYAEFTNKTAGAGLKLRRPQLEDLDGNGVDLATKWATDIGAYMAYWPQKQAAALLRNGHGATALGYDALPFFSASHPVNPFNTGAGTYANLFTGAASGSFPGACPIDDSVTVDVALVNLARAVAGIRALKMPNGVDPRFLSPEVIIAPPRMQARVQQLTQAKYIAQAAASGGGGADIEAVIRGFGFAEPIIADELAGFESDTTWFLGCREMATSQMGGLVYVERESFKITYYTGQGGGTGADAVLDRGDELEWHCRGRNVAGYGHPYQLFKIKAA